MSLIARQWAVTILKPIAACGDGDPGEDFPADFVKSIKGEGDSIRDGMNSNQGYPGLSNLEDLHFLSICIVPSDDRNEPHYVCMELSLDGPRITFIWRLVRANKGGFLKKAFRRCKGYKDDYSDKGESKWGIVTWWNEVRFTFWLILGSTRSTSYNGQIGLNRNTVLAEDKLRIKVRDFVNKIYVVATSRKDVWSRVREYIKKNNIVIPNPQLPLRVRFFHPEFRARLLFQAKMLLQSLAWVAGIYHVFGRRMPIEALIAGKFNSVWDALSLVEKLFFVVGPLFFGLITIIFWLREYPQSVRWGRMLLWWLTAVWKGFVLAVNLIAIGGFLAFAFSFLWEPWVLLASGSLILFTVLLIVIIVLFSFSRILGSVASIIFVGLSTLMVWYPVQVLLSVTPEEDIVRYLRVWGPFVIILALLPLLLIAARLVTVRREERFDHEHPINIDAGHMTRMRNRENDQLQSHFIAIGNLKKNRRRYTSGKPAWNAFRNFLRWCLLGGDVRVHTLRVVFRLLGIVHRYYLTQGWLGTISSIHFARWIILKGDRLFFLTNYDGGFAAYLGVFSENPGTTAVFGHVDGFPKPFFLFGDGARRAQQFIDFARQNQIESLIWYSAYPNITVMDIAEASQLCRALSRDVDDGKIGLLSDVKRAFKWPIKEAEICEILRTTMSTPTSGRQV